MSSRALSRAAGRSHPPATGPAGRQDGAGRDSAQDGAPYQSQNYVPQHFLEYSSSCLMLNCLGESEVSTEGARQEGIEAENGDDPRFKSLRFVTASRLRQIPCLLCVGFLICKNNSLTQSATVLF